MAFKYGSDDAEGGEEMLTAIKWNNEISCLWDALVEGGTNCLQGRVFGTIWNSLGQVYDRFGTHKSGNWKFPPHIALDLKIFAATQFFG